MQRQATMNGVPNQRGILVPLVKIRTKKEAPKSVGKLVEAGGNLFRTNLPSDRMEHTKMGDRQGLPLATTEGEDLKPALPQNPANETEAANSKT